MPKSEPGVIDNVPNSSIQTMHLGYGPDASFIIKSEPVHAQPGPGPEPEPGAGVGPGPGPGPGPYQGRNYGNGGCMSTNIGMSGGGSGSGGEVSLKKKRGRPRKYEPDGSMAIPFSVAPGFTIAQPSPAAAPAPDPPLQQTPPTYPPQQQQQQLHSVHSVNVTPVPAPDPVPGPAPASPQGQPKKTRGRPPGASNKKHLLETLGSSGIGFTPHVIIVKAGEDVSSKIMSFSQSGPRAICILSANGALSNVTLHQAAISGGLVTYEGRFEILSLSGSFMLSDSGGGHCSRTGGLSISLAGPDGRVLGGGVAGLLIAATPVQVVVASFIADDRSEVKIGNQMESTSDPATLQAGMGPTGTGTGASSPTSHGTLSESSGGGGSPINLGAGGAVNNTTNMHGLSWM